jgi:hypothetical protein
LHIASIRGAQRAVVFEGKADIDSKGLPHNCEIYTHVSDEALRATLERAAVLSSVAQSFADQARRRIAATRRRQPDRPNQLQ